MREGPPCCPPVFVQTTSSVFVDTPPKLFQSWGDSSCRMPSKARGYYAGFRFPPNRIKKMMQEDEEVGYIT